jgi:hypothetical protein
MRYEAAVSISDKGMLMNAIYLNFYRASFSTQHWHSEVNGFLYFMIDSLKDGLSESRIGAFPAEARGLKYQIIQIYTFFMQYMALPIF